MPVYVDAASSAHTLNGALPNISRTSPVEFRPGAIPAALSSKPYQHMTSKPNAYRLIPASTHRQPACCVTYAPRIGARNAIIPIPMKPRAITYGPSPAEYRSRTVARAHTRIAAMAKPCIARAATSIAALDASAAASALNA